MSKKNEIIPDINELKSSYEATAEFYKYAESEEKRLLAELVENDYNVPKKIIEKEIIWQNMEF